MDRSSLTFAILATGLLAAGCPPPPPPPLTPTPTPTPAPTPLPDPTTPPPKTGPRPDEAPPVPITSALVTEMKDVAEKTGVIRALPHIRIFTKERRLELDGATSVKVGPQLELLACSLRGKSYESLLIWIPEPEHIHLALLFLGLEPTPQVDAFGQAGPLTKGQKVVIEVEWQDPATKKSVRRRVEDLLYDTYRDGAMKYSGFVFTGSRFVDVPQPPDWEKTKRTFASTVSGTVAVVYHDPDAILDTPLVEGGNNTTYVAWADRLPERHTDIVVHIRPWREGDDVEPPENVKRLPSVERPPGGGAPNGGGGPR